MSDRDDQLDKLLKPLKNLKASPDQIARWQIKVGAPLLRRQRSTWVTRTVQLTAAMAVGFILGGLAYKNLMSNQVDSEKFDPTATITMVYSKNE
jgi:hypothetical protein